MPMTENWTYINQSHSSFNNYHIFVDSPLKLSPHFTDVMTSTNSGNICYIYSSGKSPVENLNRSLIVHVNKNFEKYFIGDISFYVHKSILHMYFE